MSVFGETPTVEALVDEAFALSENLDRQLRYVQINSFYNGSTGTIMRNLHKGLKNRGIDSYIFWGRRHKTIGDHERCFASKAGVSLHGALVRLTDRAGFYSRRDTAKLLRRLDEIDPDVVHLHNIHGYYINVEMLFDWLASHRCQVRWTLHDCWAFTGHCAYFTYINCRQWRSHCSISEGCPQLATYPRTVCKRNCAKNFADKKRIFTSVPPERMTLISPSYWLEGLLKQSFLKDCQVEVRHNIVDATVFRPTPSNFREKYGIGDRFMILGVANPWTERKGLVDFVSLARKLNLRQYAIVLVGLSKKQMKRLPEEIIALGRISSPEKLAAIYSAADVLFNPTREDNFPTVNLEAEACNTPVVTYDTGGSKETLALPGSKIINELFDCSYWS